MSERLGWKGKQDGKVSMLVAIIVRMGCLGFGSVFLIIFSGPIKHINVGCVRLER